MPVPGEAAHLSQNGIVLKKHASTKANNAGYAGE
jgi:hypothetical protein